MNSLEPSIVSYRSRKEEKSEITEENPGRWVILPIKFDKFWQAYKKYESSFWTPADIDAVVIANELDDSNIKNVASKLAAEYGCYKFEIGNLKFTRDASMPICEILDDIQVPEARSFLGFVSSFECLTVEMCSNVLNTLVGTGNINTVLKSCMVDPICANRAKLMFKYGCKKGNAPNEIPTLKERLCYGFISRIAQSLSWRYVLEFVNEKQTKDMPMLRQYLTKMIFTFDTHSWLLVCLYLSLAAPIDEPILDIMIDDIISAEIEFISMVWSSAVPIGNLNSVISPFRLYIKTLLSNGKPSESLYMGEIQVEFPNINTFTDTNNYNMSKKNVQTEKGDENTAPPEFTMNADF